MSEQQEGIIPRDEGLDRLEGKSVGESASLKFRGAGRTRSVAVSEPFVERQLTDLVGGE